eukprot:1179926-Prorocentrum_minimum.AAC.5
MTKEGLQQVYQCWLLHPGGPPGGDPRPEGRNPGPEGGAASPELHPELLATCHTLWTEMALQPVMSQFHMDVARALKVSKRNSLIKRWRCSR